MNYHMADKITEETKEQHEWGMHLLDLKKWADDWKETAASLRIKQPLSGAPSAIETVIADFEKKILEPLK